MQNYKNYKIKEHIRKEEVGYPKHEISHEDRRWKKSKTKITRMNLCDTTKLILDHCDKKADFAESMTYKSHADLCTSLESFQFSRRPSLTQFNVQLFK